MAFQYIKANGGIDTEESYPYKAEVRREYCLSFHFLFSFQDSQCVYNPANVGATCSGYTDVSSGDESALLNACYNVGPISVGMDASHKDFQVYIM